MPNPSPFRHKALAALLAFLVGGLGVERLYLGMKRWWLPLAVSAPMIPLLIGVVSDAPVLHPDGASNRRIHSRASDSTHA
jgi:hypothetical protein